MNTCNVIYRKVNGGKHIFLSLICRLFRELSPKTQNIYIYMYVIFSGWSEKRGFPYSRGTIKSLPWSFPSLTFQKTREGCGCLKLLAGKVFGQISTLLEKSSPIFRQHEMLFLPSLVAFQTQTQNRRVLATQFPKSQPCPRW